MLRTENPALLRFGRTVTPPKPPAGLAPPGKQLWRDILREWELDARELAILKRAAKQADTNDALEKAIRRDGYMIEGASGQRQLNAAVGELRQGQLALARLLGQMALPAADGSAGATATSRKAQKAANARWHPEVVSGRS